MNDMAMRHNQARPARPRPVSSLRDKRILVVEDEYHIADDVAFELRGLGAEVVGPVPTVDEGLAALDAERAIDGAVLDVNLRGKPVFPLADALRARGVPFVFSTGYDRRFIPSVYDGVVLCEKPVDARALAATLFG